MKTSDVYRDCFQRKSGNGKQLCSCQCHWDLSWLRFGDTRIAASDVDGLFVVERHLFLFIETKGITEPILQGQLLLLCALSNLPRTTVVILRGPKGYPETIQQVKHGELQPVETTSRENFQKRIDSWFSHANQFAMRAKL